MTKEVTFSREKSGGGRGGGLVGPVRDSTRQLRASFCVFRGVRDVSVRRGLQLATRPFSDQLIKVPRKSIDTNG